MEDQKNVHTDRKRLARDLGRDVPLEAWRWLEEERYTAEWRDPTLRDEALVEIREALDRRAPIAKASTVRAASLASRGAAESEILATLAASDTRIREFRVAHLGQEEPIAEDLALRFIQSDIATRASVSTVRWLKLTPLRAFEEDVHVAFGPPDPKTTVDLRYQVGDRAARIPVQRNSVAGRLAGLASWLAGKYPWAEAGAARFVLTGLVVDVIPLSARVHFAAVEGAPPTARITLEVEPWVPEETVARFYREIRSRMLSKRRGRPVGEVNAERVRFVHAERRTDPNVSWRSLADRWSTLHPDWAEEDPRHFQQSFDRATHSLTYPGYKPYEEDPS